MENPDDGVNFFITTPNEEITESVVSFLKVRALVIFVKLMLFANLLFALSLTCFAWSI